MTENEAIKRVEEFGLHHAIGDLPYSTLTVKAFEMAIKALQEIQQYRAIGTVEECWEAMERQKGKKYKKIHPCKSVTYYQCPCCNELLHINENFCGKCGQTILWEEKE